MPRKKKEEPKLTEKDQMINLMEQLLEATKTMSQKAQPNLDDKAVLIVNYNSYAMGFSEAQGNIIGLLENILATLKGESNEQA